MAFLPERRDIAQQLLQCEANANKAPGPVESATLHVYAKLRQSLNELAGPAAFHSLASRALVLSRSEAPCLNAVQVAADGTLEGISAIEPSIPFEQDRIHEGEVILISRLLGLLLVFIGEALTLSLLRHTWPSVAFDDRNSGNGRLS